MNNSGLNPRALENPPISEVICDGDRRWLLGGYQRISVSITMIDRLHLLEVVASIFVFITIMDLSLNMNDNLELFIKKIYHSRSEIFRVMLLQCVCVCMNHSTFHLCTEDNKRG